MSAEHKLYAELEMHGNGTQQWLEVSGISRLLEMSRKW